MTSQLWQFLIEDDVDSFRQCLAGATYAPAAPKAQAGGGPAGSAAFKIGSPSSLGTSPRTPLKSRKSSGYTNNPASAGRGANATLTRADLNAKDSLGRTILHHAASTHEGNAAGFVDALLQIPFLDIYAQDAESGWTALHRALYHGNVSVAQALMLRDVHDATDYTIAASHANAGGLVKIKDHEGNSPFEVFGLTIAPRVLQDTSSRLAIGAEDEESTNSVDLNDDGNERNRNRKFVQPLVDLQGDELFAFGSNKNLSLGLGDGDDRHFPERLYLQRPEHLLRRLHDDHLVERQRAIVQEDLANSIASSPDAGLPALVRNQEMSIQDVVMSKMHTAVLTNDPISNLYISGYGPGGRLGTGNESTCFNYVCVQGGGLARRKVVSVALGQDHSIAICSEGEVYTWGSNKFGQLGYALPEVSPKEVPMQLLPRQLYGLIKKELVIGAAASATHSAIYTSSGLYTFGKNDGQLGLTDADARSLEMQIIPRRVGVSVLQSAIVSVSAIERATTVLLESHDVIVFTHYAWTKVVFPLEGFTNYFISEALTTRYNMETNTIKKVTSSGNTICALSTYGEVFTVDVPKRPDTVSSNVSTTNPTKARDALPAPTRVWSIRKSHMAAFDVAVGQDGSIILCTASGSVWRKEKRANIKSVRTRGPEAARPKDYKFVRVPNLTRAVAVRSNAYGAFTTVRKDCDVTREQIAVAAPGIWDDMFPLLPFANYGEVVESEESKEPQLRFWKPATPGPSPALIKRAIIASPGSEDDLLDLCKRYEPLSETQYDIWITSNVTDVKIPVHSFLLKARSKVLRDALAQFHDTYYYSINDVMSIEYGQDGHIQLQFQGADFLTIANFVLYLYTENVIDVWHYTSQALQLAPRYRQVRTELMKIASHLDMRQLERAVRVMIEPMRCLSDDFEMAILDSHFFSDADIVIELADDQERPAHSVLLCARCPFFDGLFHGRAGGMWLSNRRNAGENGVEPTKVDLKHVEARIFDMVLRHIYADTGDELFDEVVTRDLDEFLELVIEVMSVANELMVDRLAQICQRVLGKFVTTRNICQLLNIVSECSVHEFKHAGLEYICLNLETMLDQKLLQELDHDLLEELDEVVQQNQLAYMPFARSERAHAELQERYPDLAEHIEQARQVRIDSMRLRSRLVDEPRMVSTSKPRIGSIERLASSPVAFRGLQVPASEEQTPRPSPAIAARDSGDDLPFDMDEDSEIASPTTTLPSPSIRPQRQQPDGNEQGRTRISIGSPARHPHSSVEPSSLDREGSMTGPLVPSSPQTNAVSGFELSKAAWKTTAPTNGRTDLKDIMSQASASRVSNLTRAMGEASSVSNKAPAKMSQKERKRREQQLRDEKLRSQDTTPDVSTKGEKVQSPWQKVAAEKTNGGAASIPAVTPPQQAPAPARPPLRTTMTMRQTVAGNQPVSKETPTPPKQVRSVSTPGTTPSAVPTPPQIQSIRHMPLPARSSSFIDAQSSMADILAQQQYEKAAIKEAIAKRSLQEIQQEQEFQEWWDNESRRIQEEEAQATAATPSRDKGARGRGGRRRGGARAGAVNKIGEGERKTAEPSQAPQHDEVSTPRGGGQGRARGHGRGGARGRGQ